LNIRLTLYLIFYIQKYFVPLYKEIRGGLLYPNNYSKALNTIVRLRMVSVKET
jgi:hypothetical protein